MLLFVTKMVEKKGKKESGTVRINPELSKNIKEILEKNNNKIYCDSLTSFVNVAVTQLIDDIEKKGNKIRWGKK
jgi:hypothetical protein